MTFFSISRAPTIGLVLAVVLFIPTRAEDTSTGPGGAPGEDAPPASVEDDPKFENCIPVVLSESGTKGIPLFIDIADGAFLPSSKRLLTGTEVTRIAPTDVGNGPTPRAVSIALGELQMVLPAKVPKPGRQGVRNQPYWKVEDSTGNAYYLKSGTTIVLVGATGMVKGADLTLSADGKKATLTKDVDVPISVLRNRRVPLKVASGTLARLFPRNKNANGVVSATSHRMIPGGRVTLTVKRDGFDFQGARITVHLLPPEKEQQPPFELDDVTLTASKSGEATFEVTIPEDDPLPDEWVSSSGRFGDYQAQLLVVAQARDGTLLSATSRPVRIASGIAAWFAAIGAVVVTWLIALWVTRRRDKPEEVGSEGDAPGNVPPQNPSSGENECGAGTPGVVGPAIPSSDTAPTVPRKGWWNPIQFVSGKFGRASLSLAQIFLWTVLVIAASCYILVARGELLPLTNVLTLLGIAGTTSVLAKVSASSKAAQGRELVRGLATPNVESPEWRDLLQSGGKADLFKMQMALFTLVAAIFVGLRVITHHEFPQLPDGFLTLMGISNGVYIGAKATGQSPFQGIVEDDLERKQAQEAVARWAEQLAEVKEQLEKAPGDEKAKLEKEVEKANVALESAKQRLKKAQLAFRASLKANGLEEVQS